MKKGIHPEYFKDAKTVCACGVAYKIGSTKKNLEVETCSACHPFYTGKEKLVDTAGRVERFKRRLAKSAHGGSASVGKKR